MEVWLNRGIVIWRRGYMELWLYGGVVVWRNCLMEAWLNGGSARGSAKWQTPKEMIILSSFSPMPKQIC